MSDLRPFHLFHRSSEEERLAVPKLADVRFFQMPVPSFQIEGRGEVIYRRRLGFQALDDHGVLRQCQASPLKVMTVRHGYEKVRK
jgi:hypothetical protein